MLVAGTTGGIPAVARLLRVVARLPNGAVVLPGLDTAMSEHAWSALDDAHPQAGLARLLHGLGADARRCPPVAGGGAGCGDRGARRDTVAGAAAGRRRWRNGGMPDRRRSTA